MAFYPILGVPSSFRVPGQYAEFLPAQGPATASAGKRAAVFAMAMLGAGTTWTAGTVYRVKNEQAVIAGACTGSPVHRGLRKALLHNKTAVYYALPYAPTTGGSPIAAAGTFTITGTATATGSAEVEVQGEPIQFSFKKDDTPTLMGDALEAAINAKTWLACTAANAAGVVTLTANIAGESQGDGVTGVIRTRIVDLTAGAGVTLAVSGDALGLGTGTAGVEGSTTEATQLETALANVESSRYYYMGINVFDATGIGKLKTHVATKSEPRPGLRSVGVSAFTGLLATAQTTATGLNNERIQVVWQLDSNHDPAELVGNVIAIRQKREELDAGYNFDNYAESDWGISAAYADADWPDDDDKNDAINDGITVIASNESGSHLVMSTTTRSKNSAGTIDDFRATESHRVSIGDELLDTLLLRHALTYPRHKLQEDKKLSDGSIDYTYKPPQYTVIPSHYKAWLLKQIKDYGERTGNLQEFDEVTKASLDVKRDPNNTGRLECSFDFRTTDLLHQVTYRAAEVSPG